MNSSRYLDRIGYATDDRSLDGLESLARLQHHHLQAVPFTNFFVRSGDGTTLHPDAVVPRIVAGGGGLCYDLNGSFAWLLTELGYDVTLVSARPLHDDGTYGPEYDHLALLVEDHLVDVGFGDFARQPLPLDGDSRIDVSGTYRVVDRDGGLTVRKLADGDWEDAYRFSTVPRAPDEFAEMMEHHATSPDSPFTGDLLATLPTEDGRITLSGDSLTVTAGDTRRKRALFPREVDAVLRDQFGLPDP